MASGQIRGHEAPGELGGTSPPLLEAWLARHLICFLRKHLPLETGWIVNEDSVSCTLGPVFYTRVTRSRSESTSQFTALALNKPSSSTSSSSPPLLLFLIAVFIRPFFAFFWRPTSPPAPELPAVLKSLGASPALASACCDGQAAAHALLCSSPFLASAW